MKPRVNFICINCVHSWAETGDDLADGSQQPQKCLNDKDKRGLAVDYA